MLLRTLILILGFLLCSASTAVGQLPGPDLPGQECQSVTAELLPSDLGDNIQDPVLLGQDLDCSFPVEAEADPRVRLFGRASIFLYVHVLPNGEVGDVDAPQSGIQILTKSAIDIAKRKLKFRPGLKNGHAVETIRPLRLTFKIIRPLTLQP